MKLVTSSVFYPGAGAHVAHPEQVLVDITLGLLAVAQSSGAGEADRAAVRMGLEAARAHLTLHRDVLERFRREPAAALRERISEILSDAVCRAAREVFAFARRHQGLALCLDLVVITPPEVFVAHVGEGRVYMIRDALVHQLTVDHAARLGPALTAHVESLCLQVCEGDRLVLTGLCHRAFEGAELRRILAQRDVHELGPALRAGLPERLGLTAACARVGERGAQASGTSRLELLAPMELFRHCTRAELRAVAQATRPWRRPEGTVVFRQGEPGTRLFLVLEGAIDIVRDGRHLVTLEAGETFGEMAMLDEPERSATALVREDCELLLIPRAAFFSLLQSDPALAVKILWNMNLRLSANLRSTSSRLAVLERRLREA